MHCWKPSPTNGADDARVAGHSGFRVDVQQTHVFDEGVRYCSVKLLGVDDRGAHILWLRHDWIRVCWTSPEKTRKEQTDGCNVSANMEWKTEKPPPQRGAVEAEGSVCEYRRNNNSTAECIPPHSCRRLGKRWGKRAAQPLANSVEWNMHKKCDVSHFVRTPILPPQK